MGADGSHAPAAVRRPRPRDYRPVSSPCDNALRIIFGNGQEWIPPGSVVEAGAERLRGGLREHASLLANLGYAALVALTAGPGGHLALAVGLLSFWHYYFYALAYCLGAVRLQAFKRDAIVMKGLALLLPGWLYLSAPLDALSLAVVAAGFLLNIAAARALGSDRTYYGVEVSALPPQRVTAFPYSWTSHPMLLGNIAAYAGTLLNAPFREHWWPLALAHVAFNLGLLVMETSVRPRHGGRRAAVGSPTARGQFGPIHLGLGAALTGGLIGAALGTWGNHAGGTALGATLGAATLIHAFVIFRCYSAPTIAPDECSTATAQASP